MRKMLAAVLVGAVALTSACGGEATMTTINGLTIPMQENWEVRGETLVDRTACAVDTECVTLRVASRETTRNMPEAKQLDHPPCLRTDGKGMFYPSPDPAPVLQGEREVGGVKAKYYVMRLCPANVPQATMKYWIFSDRRSFITLSEPAGRLLEGVDEALAQAKWE